MTSIIDLSEPSAEMLWVQLMPELRGEQYDLLIEAVRKCFWYKKPFVTFLVRCGVPSGRASRVHEGGSKTAFFRDLVAEYAQTSEGRELLHVIAVAVMGLKHFTALDNEDQIREAKEATSVLRESFEELPSEMSNVIRDQANAIGRIPEAKHGQLRGALRDRLNALLSLLGTREGGEGFEDLFCDLVYSEDLETRKPFRVGNIKQLDGSVSVLGNIYLIESKFKSDKADAPEVRDFISKIKENADLTQGLFVSMCGYTSSAVVAASRAGSPVVLLDGEHITNAVYGGYSIERMIILAKRYASETGSAFLSWSEMKERLAGAHCITA